MADPGAGLLATKLDVPRLRPGYLHRPRLRKRLDAAIPDAVIVVNTPAGYGKTSLLAEWATHTAGPVAWLSLDSGDNDPVRFWRYVAAAAGGASIRLADHMRGLLESPGVVTGERVVAGLTHAMQEEPRQVTLVLDDYHAVELPQLHQEVGSLLAYRPTRFRVVVSSRGDPPLPLARLRARGELVELLADDLRFTSDETAAVLRKSWGVELSEASAATLEHRTEGWVVGLQLAAVALRGRPDADAAVLDFAGTHRFVLDYLSDEVLDRQPEPVRAFMLRCCVLDHLSAELCDTVTGGSDGQQMLDHLDRANLFLVPLDDHRRWYRFHHLFSELLRDRLRRAHPDLERQLHRAAGAWYEHRGQPDTAIRHAVAAGEHTWAARLVERHADELLLRSEGRTLSRWIAALPAELVKSRPRLLVSQARFRIYESRLQGIEQLLDDAASALARADSEPYQPSGETGASPLSNLTVTHGLLRAFAAHLRGDADGAARHAIAALRKTSQSEWALQRIAQANLATAEWLRGRLERAEVAMAENLEAWQATGEPGRAAWSCHYLGQIQRGQGRLGAAAATYQRVLDSGAATGSDAGPLDGVAQVGLAAVAYQRNDLDAAGRHIALGIDICRRFVHTLPLAAGLSTLALIRYASGDVPGATAAITEAGRIADPAVADLLNPAPTVRAWMLLAMGDVDTAAALVAGRGLTADDEPCFPREPGQLVLARVLLARRLPDRALELLDRLRAAAVDQRRTGSLIEIDALRSLAAQASGDQTSALAILSHALEMAAQEGHVRTFVDAGPAMAALLRTLTQGRRRHQQRALAPAVRDHANRVLRGFRPRPGAEARVTSPGMVSPLTAREAEVLALIAAGRPNQQIAAELFVTLDTVKKHLSHVYTKLGVTSRTAALARARELDLLQ